MRCNAPSYEGKDAYVYFAYCADDSGIAIPSIERMARSGLRICYPDYENLFAESYASQIEKINGCSALIVMLTEDVITSHIVRKFLNTATKRRKPIAAIRFNDAQMTPAMKLQFEKASVFDYYNFTGDPLTQTVFGVSAVSECISMPNYGIEIQKIVPKYRQVDELNVYQMDDKTVREIRKELERVKDVSSTDVKKEETKEEEKKAPSPTACDDLDKTVTAFEELPQPKETPEEKTVKAVQALPVIVSMTTGEWKRGRFGDAVVGRKKNAETDGDITFTDPCRLFSGKHFQLIYLDEVQSIVSLHSNGMSVDGTQLEKGENIRPTKNVFDVIIPGARVLMANCATDIQPAMFAVAFGAETFEIVKAGRIACVSSAETGETRFFHQESFLLGKNNSWEKGALSSRTISKMHATLIWNGNQYDAEVHSSNGLYINDSLVKKGERVTLKSGDKMVFPGNKQLGIPFETLIYRMVALKKEG